MQLQRFPTPDGSLEYARAPIDSDLFGFDVFELGFVQHDSAVVADTLAHWLAEVPTSNPCLTYTSIPAREIALAELLSRHDFYYVESMFDAFLSLVRYQPAITWESEKTRLRPATEDDLPRIQSIAESTFRADRLHLDPNLSSTAADERYRRWIERGFRSGEPVLVYLNDQTGEVLGFFNYVESSPDSIYVGLAAVDQAYLGTGLAARMFQAALSRCQQQGFRSATARISANNINSINLAAAIGFSFRTTVAKFHRFRADDEPDS